MRFKSLILGGISLLAITSTASADDSYSQVEGPGILLSDSSVLHPSLGAEVGVDSNVFREEDQENFSAWFRLSAALDVASLGQDRLRLDDNAAQPKLIYRVGVSAAYTEYLSGNSDIRAQRNLSLTADADFKILPAETFTLEIQDHFVRVIRPRNFESNEQLPRDINTFRVDGGVQPGGRSIYAGIYYQNLLDYFESVGSRFANRINHDIGLQIRWQWRPFTRIWFDASYGFYGGFQTEAEQFKVPSNPLRLRTGIASALTERLSASVFAGYAQGNYEEGASFNAPIFGAEASYKYSLAGKVTLSYNYDNTDSINSNFFSEHVIRARLQHNVQRIQFSAYAANRFRTYNELNAAFGAVNGETTRDDVIFDTGVGLRYWANERLALQADYYFVVDETDFRSNFGVTASNTLDDPSFLRHTFWVGAQLAY